jgi:hypothetical protein
MDPITITIITYVSLKFLDQFLKEEGYGRLKKFLFPEKKYKNQLIKVIYATIEEHEKDHPYSDNSKRFPFYHSQIVFEELNKHILFKTKYSSYNDLLKKLGENPNIIIPSQDELNNFYDLLVVKINKDKKLKVLFIDENYKSKIFVIFETLKKIDIKIDAIQDKIISLETNLTFQPNEEWFKKQCQSSIFDLGSRYTPELNFELEISSIFDGLGRTEGFKKKITKQFDGLLIKGKKVLKNKPETKEHINTLEKLFDEIYTLFTSIDFGGNFDIPFQNFDELLQTIANTVEKLEVYYREEESKIQKEKNDYHFYHKYGYELRNIREFENTLYDFKEFLNGDICQLANTPFLILDGEAGIGKSHMLGDIISKRIKNEYESVFLLGQQFVTDEDPWTQIFKRLQINIKSDIFLNIINDRAKNSGKRIVIFIDAINEGRGKYFWNDNVKSFINEFKKYEWLSLVLTIRSSYKSLIFPEAEIDKLNVIEHTLYGFRNNEYEASKLFFNNYNIDLPNVPLLHPEFQNPLFLKLFCEGISKSGLTKIPDGLQGITSIINFFIKNVNEVLSKPKRFDFSNGINLVYKTINSIIEFKINSELRYVNYEKAIEIVEDTVFKFVSKKGVFLDELISEGIFSKNLFWKAQGEYEEGIYLAYERFEDHLTCQHLLEKYSSNIETEFNEDGKLFQYVKDENDIYRNKGLIDAFSIQIPEKTGKEFYDYIPHLKDKYPIVESFVESLLWRKVETINEESKDYINNCVFSFQGTHDLFWETILSVTSIPEHFFNAYSLHNHLMKFSLAERDAGWTQSLKYKYNDDSSVKRLIDWAWNESDKSYISDESIKLSSIALAWFHTSTNRQLRDCSTKALVCLLQDRIKVLIEILKTFENINDTYVYERLFAVAYGCTLRTNHKESLSELSEYIHNIIFKEKDEIYPHALLRDYARGVIEYTHYFGIKLSFDINEVRPPYKSKFYDTTASNDEIIQKYKLYYKSDKFKDCHWGQNSILSSMETEHGPTMYGDFGRYTFQSALRSWDVNPNSMSNLAISWIFERYGYNVELHGKFDSEIGSGRGRDTIPNERIGKKYQWLALHEMVARVSDNFKKFEEWGFNKKNEEPYQGTWSPFIRDIDPTMLIHETGSYEEDEKTQYWWSDKNTFNWECSNDEWVKNSDNLPAIESLIQVKDSSNNEWLILEGYPEWAEPKKIGEEKWDYAHKRLWSHIRSYIVKDEDYTNLKDWAIKQDFMGRWMPESSDRYEIFSREYYWSPAHKYFTTEYYGGSEWRDIHDNNTGEFIASVIVPTESFLWEEEFDKSKEETIRFLKPCANIYKGMNLSYSRREGEFLNTKNEMVCFATNVYFNSKSFLLIKKGPLIKYLKENNLKIVWTILGEKQIIGGRTMRDDYIGMLEISGAYYLEDNRIEGSIITKQR